MKSLKGYRTHLVAAMIAGAGVLRAFDLISDELLTVIVTVLTGTAFSTLRASVR